jgi:hypothetical protein
MALVVDLYCGLGGWSEGFLAEGYDCIGFDIERHQYGDQKYPGMLAIQDVLTLHGSQFKDATVIVASPPCQEFSYMAMPWSLAKEKRRNIKDDPAEQKRLTTLFDACFRIQREACEAAGQHIPLIVENVRGAQEWVGRARWNFGSFYLWGDLPALMPPTFKATKVPSFRFDGSGKSFQTAQVHATGRSPTAPGSGNRFTSRSAGEAKKGMRMGSGADYGGPYDPRRFSGGSTARKAASAMIAKIPLPLSRHLARVFK